MKANLTRDGQLNPPGSALSARKRIQQLNHEVNHIEAQLADPVRALRYPSVATYESWARSAGNALRTLRSELLQTEAWLISNQDDATKDLLSRARDLLRLLVDDGIELEPEELHLIDKIDTAVKGAT